MPVCGHTLGCTGVPRGPGGGDKATQACVRLPRGGTPSLGWSVILSGTEKFSDFEGEFNYMLSPTSSGDDGTITHVIYQQDTCIHNKPKAKHHISVKAKNIKLRPDVRRAHWGGGGGRKAKALPSLFRARCPHPPGPNPRGESATPLRKGRGRGRLGELPALSDGLSRR